MQTKRLVIGTLVGASALSVTGFLVFGVLFPEFYTNFLNGGTATGVARLPMLWWAVAVGMLTYALLIVLAVETRTTSGSLTVTAGTIIGAVVSFLVWFTADILLYGISNVGNVTGVIVDPFLEAIPGAVAGGVIAAVLGNVRERRSDAKRAA
jgi:hypothetical protein